MSRWTGAAVVALALALGASGCNVVLSTGVDVGDDGSGVVHAGVGFDDAALAEVGDLRAALQVDDLRQAGWTVTGPAKEADGLTWVRASKGFDAVEEAAAIARQLSGPDGPFRDFTVTRKRTLLRTRTKFTGVVDLTAGLTGLSDAELQAALGDFDLDLDVEGLNRRVGDSEADGVLVEVRADLPGKAQATPITPFVQGGRVRWTAVPGDHLEFEATAELTRIAYVVYGALALVGAAAALVVVLRIRLRRRQRRSRR